MNNSTCYPPSEDTFLLEESIKKEKGHIAIEVGAGTGYLSLVIKDNFNLILATDISLYCLKKFKEKIREKGIANIELILADLLTPIRNYDIDLIFFNPPYLPKDEFKTNIDDFVIYQRNGRNIINDFLKQTKRFKTKVYFVCSSLSNFEKDNVNIEVVLRKKLFFEEIYVLKFSTF
ncbi:MAG: methyltransferase [Thermoproteota archaeon]|nr:methyltransferase [Thermoproteota archaeon]